MKFTIKHALVVAIAALCVCVVGTGTVLAVTLNNREAEAFTGSFTINVSTGTVAEQNAGHILNITSVGGSIVTGTSVPLGTTFWVAVAPGRTISNLNFGGDYGGGFPLADYSGVNAAANNAFWGTTMFVESWAHGTWVYITVNNPRFAGTTHQLIVSTVPRVALNTPLLHRITRRHGTTSAGSNLAQGWHDVTATGGTLPPVGTGGTFRGWSTTSGGAVVFPVGLPIPIFSDMELWAIR